MKRKYRILISILCLVCLTVCAAAFTACGEEKTITYTGSTLAEATAGKAYTASVATATGVEGITYDVKSSTPLPSGLAFSADGVISGTPTAEAAAAKFTVVASAEGASRVEAEFTLTVKAEAVAIEGFVMEAEWANLENMRYMAGSNTPRKFYRSAAASNGMYMGDLGYADSSIGFTFTASQAGEATVKAYMKSGISSFIDVYSSTIEVKMNGVAVPYTKVRLEEGGGFKAVSIKVTLAATNTLTFKIVDNTEAVLNGVPVMPNFDCVSVTAKTEGTQMNWTPNTDNY